MIIRWKGIPVRGKRSVEALRWVVMRRRRW